ncbi:MAG TPA: 2-isopropylmalate synthase, partial [Methanolinea sp.]|nr:2-isopropylmalate synthase [Methanolinea sp.]
EMVGHRRKLALGKHVGRHAVRQMLQEVHLSPSDGELDRIVEKIKFISVKGKRVTDADLFEIAETVMGIENGGRAIEMEDLAVMTGNHVIPTASVKALVNGREHIYSSTGNGPVDAVLKAIMGLLATKVQLKDFNIEAISGGSDAIGHVTIAVEDEHGRIFDASASSDDVVLASAEAMINALNMLHRVEKQ